MAGCLSGCVRPEGQATAFLAGLRAAPEVSEALVLFTCDRGALYAEVTRGLFGLDAPPAAEGGP